MVQADGPDAPAGAVPGVRHVERVGPEAQEEGEAMTEETPAGYWALLDTRVAGNRCRIYATEHEATEAMEAQVTRAAEHAAREAREKLLVVHRGWGDQPNEPLNARHG